MVLSDFPNFESSDSLQLSLMFIMVVVQNAQAQNGVMSKFKSKSSEFNF